jgi:5-carboxymethyl-2-hydroxymuconate isomerase
LPGVIAIVGFAAIAHVLTKREQHLVSEGMGKVMAMPHIAVEYSDKLDEVFDRRGFARALHPLTAKTIDTTIEGCRTRFRRIEEADAYLGEAEPERAMVHVELAILSGRTPEVKAELTGAVMVLLREHLSPDPATTVQVSVNVTDLDSDVYRSGVV